MMNAPVLPFSLPISPGATTLTEGAVGDTAQAQGNQMLGMCRALSESPKWNPLVGDIEDDYMRGVTAMLLEAQDLYSKSLVAESQSSMFSEATLTGGISTFTKFSFPIVRGIIPNLIASEIVSVQPMLGPASVVFHMKIVAGSAKGATARGRDLAEDPDQDYSSEAVTGESVGTGDNVVATFNTNLSYTPVRPNTVSITDTSVTATDDGNGNLSGTGITSGTVNYDTGAVSITFTTPPGTNDPITADYRYDQEGSDAIPEVDIVITSSPVVARPRKLRSRYSMESAQNLRVVHGLDADQEIGNFMVQELRFEIDREIISQVQSIASAGSVTFDQTPGSGVGLDEHLRGFKKTLEDGGNLIFSATKRAQGNWIVTGIDGGGIFSVLPGFVGSGLSNQMGVVNLGTLDGRWTVYKDPYLTDGDFVIGHRGQSFMETGFVLAFYVPLFATPSITLDDFLTRRGMGTLYAKKAIDGRFYATGTITAS